MSISLRSRTLRRIALDTLRVYLSPIYNLRKSDLRLERLYYISNGRRSAAADTLNLLRRIGSYNQSAIIEFVFILAERHKKLRIALNNGTKNLRPHINDIISLMNLKFFEAISKNFEFIHEHFLHRSTIKPRLSVKGHWRTEETDKIITIFRDCPMEYGDVFLLDDNSAIRHCATYGTPYLCNNIVRAVFEGSYTNQRIDSKAAKRIISRSFWGGGLPGLHRNWKAVWMKGAQAAGAFKSTLVVPISVPNDRLSEETRRRFDVGSSDRTIFGYLCFDHLETDFFDREIDVPIAEMVADILSIFAFQRIRFTDYSETFKSAEARSRIRKYLDESEWSMEDVLGNVKAALEGQSFKSDSEPSTYNTLLNADELLLKLLEEPSRNAGTQGEVLSS